MSQPSKAGAVVAIHISPASEAPMEPMQEVRAVPGLGLEGDRYYARAGTYSDVPEPGREVTLVEIEALDAIKEAVGVELPAGDTRRNIATRGVSLNDLVGREFQVGEVTLRGVELCEPCVHTVQLVGPQARSRVLRSLVHRGGLRADIVSGGVIRVGDPVEV